MIDTLKQQYYYFFRKVFKRRYQFIERDEKVLKNFSSLIYDMYNDGAGEEWLFEYLTFQFNKYSSADTKMTVQLNWIFGKKALKMWRERNIEHHKYFDNQFLEKYNIKKKDLIKQPAIQLSKEYLSKERNRFSNINRKFLHCVELDLYDEKSPDCMFCANKKKCEKLKTK